ncbi:protein MAK16 [Pseudoscourfieldia marina]
MACNDEVIWQVINNYHCSFKAKVNAQTQNFCKNEYNVTGLCNRSSCPLANARYATIREQDGTLYLYTKCIERAHLPKQLWEKRKLKANYAKALEQVDKLLEFWPKFLVHKNKQRLTKMHQYLIRVRKLAARNEPETVTLPNRKEKMLRRKEAKAEKAAQLDNAIEKELLERLQSGTYGDIYNFPTRQYEKALQEVEEEEEEEEELEVEVEDDDEEEEEEEEEEEVEFVEGDFEDSDDEEDLEDLPERFGGRFETPTKPAGAGAAASAAFPRASSKRRRGVEVERELVAPSTQRARH